MLASTGKPAANDRAPVIEDLVWATCYLAVTFAVRIHGATQRVDAEAFATEQPELQTLPAHRLDAVLKLERRVSHDGVVAVGGNFYSVPDRARRVVEVQQLPDMIRILEPARVIAEHPVLEGRKQYRLDRSHRNDGGGAARCTGVASDIPLVASAINCQDALVDTARFAVVSHHHVA